MMKKKSGKRFLSWLLAAVMIIALMPANAFANDDNDYGGIDTYANQSNDNVEFWCTNSRVNVGGKTSASLNSLLSGKTQLVFAQESSLQEGTLTNGSGLTGKLWKVMVQDNRNKQTGNSNDNKTGTGTEITSIWGEWKWIHFQGYRYQYNYLTADGKTGTLRSNQTVVVYYKQVFVTDSNYGIIYGTDWGYNDGSHDDAPTRITYQFAQENNNGTPTILKSGDYWYAKKTDPIKGIGAQLNPKYEISKITVDDTECTNGEEISLDRQSSHVVTFYIRSVETTKVQYNWIGAENLGDDVKLPTDTGDYNWGDTATLTEEAAAFTPNLIKKGTDGVKYMFSGWYDNHEFKGSPVTSITVSDTNYTFYGRWTSAAVEVDLNKDDSNTNRFEKTLTNAEKLSDNAEREFTISITNDDDSNETYTGTATVSKENPTAPFEFDETQKMVFDIDDAGIGEDGTVPENGVDYTYTVKEETSGSSDDIEFDNATYKMKVNLKLEDGNLVATVSFTDATEGAVTTPITFTNTYTPAYPVYVYGRYMHNNDHLKGDVTVNNEKVQWNADSTNQNAKEYYITFGKIEKGTKVEATEGATTSDLLFSTDSITLNEEFSGTGSAASNNVSLSNVNSWGNVHACPGAVGYTNEGFAWHMDGNINVYTVAYDDGVDDASVTNMPTNPQGYFFGSYTTAAAPSREGYDFQGWKAEGTDNVYEANQEFTLNGDVTLVAQWTLSNANVTFMIDGGTWDGTNSEDQTTTVILTNGAGYLKEEQLPKGTHTPDANHIGTGYWKIDKGQDITSILIQGNTDFIYTFNERGTVATELSKLIQKEFKSQYNYSTEGTFTATAEVIAEPVAIAISYTAEEMDEPTEARIYDGTVTLKTGETKAFDFSAKDKMADVLTPNTRYTVRVSEDKGDLSKVTYDTTKYILGFETDGNAVVDYIWIAKEKDSENDHPELEPVEGTTITFHNIYTYKRHHSSSDGGNGGGKKEEKPTVEIKDDDALGLNNTDHFAYIVGYGNGEVRPQNSITRAEVAAIFFRLLEDDVRDANYTRQNKFTDVSNDAWYCSAVSTLSAMGIISGYPDATFRPNASITRAEFAAIATRFDVNGDKTPASFNDIAGHWAKDEIAVAANNGWVNGYEDGSFRPQNKITRAETMSLVNRVLNRKPETAEDLLENMTKWIDNADTNAWYYLAVQEATNSHYYEYKEKSQYEKWTELRETRDWSELDK